MWDWRLRSKMGDDCFNELCFSRFAWVKRRIYAFLRDGESGVNSLPLLLIDIDKCNASFS